MARTRFVPPFSPDALREVARVRVLYADTDKLGIVYHAAYFRYLELGRGALLRAAGVPYVEIEDEGLAFPVVDLAVHYDAPSYYDDHLSIDVGIARITAAQVEFAYALYVRSGGRAGIEGDVRVLTAVTRHACIRVASGRPSRLPAGVVERLGSW